MSATRNEGLGREASWQGRLYPPLCRPLQRSEEDRRRAARAAHGNGSDDDARPAWADESWPDAAEYSLIASIVSPRHATRHQSAGGVPTPYTFVHPSSPKDDLISPSPGRNNMPSHSLFCGWCHVETSSPDHWFCRVARRSHDTRADRPSVSPILLRRALPGVLSNVP